MTAEQISWAETHDWFVRYDALGLYVHEQWVDRDGRFGERMFYWVGSFKALREWAGY